MLLKPIVTEKSLAGANNSRYTFKVDVFDTKTQIKKMIEKMFGVKVVKIQTQVVSGKTKRRAVLPDWKKAIVTLAAGQKITLFDNLGQK